LIERLLSLELCLLHAVLPSPVLAAFAGLDGARGEVCFALGFVVVEGDYDVGE
jgi:hypothetical protein